MLSRGLNLIHNPVLIVRQNNIGVHFMHFFLTVENFTKTSQFFKRIVPHWNLIWLIQISLMMMMMILMMKKLSVLEIIHSQILLLLLLRTLNFLPVQTAVHTTLDVSRIFIKFSTYWTSYPLLPYDFALPSSASPQKTILQKKSKLKILLRCPGHSEQCLRRNHSNKFVFLVILHLNQIFDNENNTNNKSENSLSLCLPRYLAFTTKYSDEFFFTSVFTIIIICLFSWPWLWFCS